MVISGGKQKDLEKTLLQCHANLHRLSYGPALLMERFIKVGRHVDVILIHYFNRSNPSQSTSLDLVL
jgi:hypothetical protein